MSSLAARLRLECREYVKIPTAISAPTTPRATPTPMPALAPVDKPPEEGEEVAVGLAGRVTVVVDECDVELAVAEEVDDDVVAFGFVLV